MIYAEESAARKLASNIMTRIGLDLDPSVLSLLRERASTEGRSMGSLASEILARALNGAVPAESPRLNWNTKHMGLPHPDLEDKEIIQSILDSEP